MSWLRTPEIEDSGVLPATRYTMSFRIGWCPTSATAAKASLLVDDLVRGRVEFASDGIGDFIIVKSEWDEETVRQVLKAVTEVDIKYYPVIATEHKLP